jgi:hypothetical protein
VNRINLEAKVIFVLGFGFGYHLCALLEKISSPAKIIVIDPSLGLFREALRYVRLDYLWRVPSVSLFLTLYEFFKRPVFFFTFRKFS